MKACALVLVALLIGACAPKRVAIPTGAGIPEPGFAAAFQQAESACSGVRTLTAQLGLAGRAGRQRLRGTLVAGFEQPASLRLEGVAPFGAPLFILVARDNQSTLVLERDNRVVSGVSAADILDALIGVRLDAALLRAVLSGCVVPNPQPANGRRFPNGWVAVDVAQAATVYMRRDQGQWRVIAGQLPGFEVAYDRYANGRPQHITLQSTSEEDGDPIVNLDLSVSQEAINTTLKPNAFDVTVPAGAKPMTLDELRSQGPLGGEKKAEKKKDDEKKKD